MRISVKRTGGFAGLTRRWAVEVGQPELRDEWLPIIESCPWDEVPQTQNQPDRYMYWISAGEREAYLPEQDVTGPWRQLVDRTLESARQEEGRRAERGPQGPDGFLRDADPGER